MKIVLFVLMLIFIFFLLTVGVYLLYAPQCESASFQQQIEMRCQSALYQYRG